MQKTSLEPSVCTTTHGKSRSIEIIELSKDTAWNRPCCVLNTTLVLMNIKSMWMMFYGNTITMTRSMTDPLFTRLCLKVFVYFSLNPDASTQSLPPFKRDNFWILTRWRQMITLPWSCSTLLSQWVVRPLLEQDTGVASGQIWQRSGNILYHPEMGLIQNWNKTPPASGMLFYQITSNWPLLPIKANGHTN